MILHVAPIFLLALPPAQAASAGPGLRLDPAAPPVQIDAGRWAFPRQVDAPAAVLEVRPAVVLHLDPGVAPPDGAVHLGGRSWRLDVDGPSRAVSRALELDAAPGVLAFPDVFLPKERTQDVPGATDPRRGGQWYLDDLQYDELLALWTGDPGTRVAVIDSGIDIAHGDLAPVVDAPYDAFDSDDDPSPNPGEYCYDGSDGICDEHGTAVSGVMVAQADNDLGIVGMCPDCTLVPIKLLGEGGSGSTLSRDVRAFEHAIEQDVAVINNSWGFTESIPVPGNLAAVIERASTEPRAGKGALVVFAAGNDDRDIEADELQAMPEILCVSAVDSYGSPTNYTNYGAPIDVAAPSATVTIAPEDGTTENFGGTSAAAPVASGLAAWAASVDPELTAAELHDLLVDTAVPSPLVTHDESGHNEYFGYGIIDAVAVRDALWVSAEDTGGEATAGGCGCAAGPGSTGGGLLAALGLLMVGLLRRRG